MSNDAGRSFDLSRTYVHLGLGSVAFPLPDFEWSSDYLEGYERDTELDGPEGRLVVLNRQEKTWTAWERHPAGDEVVVQLSGRVVLVQELDSGENRVELGPGEAVINPRNVWHTADVIEPGDALFITPGRGTQHRER